MHGKHSDSCWLCFAQSCVIEEMTRLVMAMCVGFHRGRELASIMCRDVSREGMGRLDPTSIPTWTLKRYGTRDCGYPGA